MAGEERESCEWVRATGAARLRAGRGKRLQEPSSYGMGGTPLRYPGTSTSPTAHTHERPSVLAVPPPLGSHSEPGAIVVVEARRYPSLPILLSLFVPVPQFVQSPVHSGLCSLRSPSLGGTPQETVEDALRLPCGRLRGPRATLSVIRGVLRKPSPQPQPRRTNPSTHHRHHKRPPVPEVSQS